MWRRRRDTHARRGVSAALSKSDRSTVVFSLGCKQHNSFPIHLRANILYKSGRSRQVPASLW